MKTVAAKASSLHWLADELRGLREGGLLRLRREVVPLPDGWCELDGGRLRNFASNDYLNLAHDQRLIKFTSAALKRYGVGARASALVAGRTTWHAQLESRLAAFENQQAALLFPTGYAANVGVITALAARPDVVFCDRLNHASLVDGCRLSGAKLRVYRHDDLGRLERELAKAGRYRRRFLVTDGLFSMDGDLAPLPALCELAERFDAALIVDEAHATGVLGANGRGAAERLHVEDRVAVRTGTLSKALGALGGFVAGPRALIDWLWNNARTQMFSTALPPAVCAAACEALAVIGAEPWRRDRALDLADRFRGRLLEEGLRTVPHGAGPIVPLLVGRPEAATVAAAELAADGFLVAPIRPPTVPQGTSRLRIAFTAAHTDEDVERLVAAVADVLHGKAGGG